MICQKFKSQNELKLKTHCQIFPSVSDRDFWRNVGKEQIKFFENTVNELEKEPKKILTARLYREFATNGNRINYENIYFLRRAELVSKAILECFYNDGRYLEDILDLAWMILEETTWTLPAHNREVKASDSLPDFEDNSLDLFLAETACTMAFLYQTLGEKLDTLSRVVTRRIKKRLTHDVIDDYLKRDDYWWMGFKGGMVNNWNPWINSNVLAVSLIIEDDREKLKKLVYKLMKTLDNYFDNYPQDGACDEGPSYWNQAGLSMLENLWLLDIATDGQLNFYSEEKVKNTLSYVMKVYTGHGEFVNFADSGVRLPIYYSSLYKFATFLKDQNTLAFAKHLYDIQHMSGITPGRQITAKVFRMMDFIKYSGELEKLGNAEFLSETDYYFPSTQVMTSKSDQDPQKGLYLAAKGGHNNESHNHNDIGQFIVYKNGTKFIIDSGNMVYSKITFSDKRYTLWTTRSKYHNVPLIDGCEQKEGAEFKATDVKYEKTDTKTSFSLDIKDAYINRGKINKWIRTIEHDKISREINVSEDFDFTQKMEYELTFLTPCSFEKKDFGILFTAKNGETLVLEIDMSKFKANVEKIETDDKLIIGNWGDTLYRISLSAKSNKDKISYKIK